MAQLTVYRLPHKQTQNPCKLFILGLALRNSAAAGVVFRATRSLANCVNRGGIIEISVVVADHSNDSGKDPCTESALPAVRG